MRVTRWFNMGHVLPTKWDIRPRLLGDLSAAVVRMSPNLRGKLSLLITFKTQSARGTCVKFLC